MGERYSIEDILHRLDEMTSDVTRFQDKRSAYRKELADMMEKLHDHSEIKHLISALQKEYPYVVAKTDLIEVGIKIRKEILDAMEQTEPPITDDVLKSLKLKQELYNNAVAINDSLAKQMANLAGATADENTEEAESGRAQKILSKDKPKQ